MQRGRMSVACVSKSSLNLSLLSRGIGAVKRNGHERIDVFLEPQDCFNFVDGGGTGRRFVGHLSALTSSKPAAAAVAMPSSNENSDPSTTTLPKTFSTRKGALLLFSEDLAEKMRRRKSKTRKRLRRKALQSNITNRKKDEEEIGLDLDTLENLTNAILTYGNEESRIHLKFIKSQRTPRPIRPGFSAKRYLSRLTRALDDAFLDTLMNKGFVSEKTLFTSNSLLPHLRRRIDDDLSHAPAPYRILREMLTGPGLLSGFSFYSDGSEMTFIVDQLRRGEKDGELLQVLEIRNGVQTPVNYHQLSQVEKEKALADVLVKSAIGHVLKTHKQNLTFPAAKEDASEDSESTGGSSRMGVRPRKRVNMMDAVQVYLRGSQTDWQTIPKVIRGRPQILGDQQSTSDDLYASDPSTVGDSLSFSSSRRSSIGVPVVSFGHRGQSVDRQNQHKMSTHPVHVMSPIIDSRLASREVTLNVIPVLPPIAVKTSYQGREALVKSDGKLSEKLPRGGDDDDEQLSQMLTGVLKCEGFIQNVYAYDAKKTSGPSSVHSFGRFKGGSTQRHKKNIQQKPSLKGVGGSADGSVIMMPGGEVIQVGHSVALADIYQNKKLALDGKGALPSDAALIQRLAEGARNLASLVLSNPDSGQDLKNDAMRAAGLWMATRLELPDIEDQQAIISIERNLQSSATRSGEIDNQSVAEYSKLITGTLLSVVSRVNGEDISASPEKTRISPELMQSLLTRTVDPNELTIVDDAAGRRVITVRRNGKKNDDDKRKTVSRSSTHQSNASSRDISTDLQRATETVESNNTDKKHLAKSPEKLTDELESVGKGKEKMATTSETHLVRNEVIKRKEVEKKSSRETKEEETTKSQEFAVGASKKAATKKKRKVKQRKGETEDDASPDQTKVSLESTKKEDPHRKGKSKVPVEDADFVFASETWSDDDHEGVFSSQSRISNATAALTAKSQTDDDNKEHPYLSDASSSSKSELNKQNRAAQREAKAEERRQDVQRKRREREEQLRKEKEEAERMEQMARELEEERLRKEEARRLEKESLEEVRRRREEERLARERRAEMEAEKERRMKDEYAKKLEEMKRKQEEEARLRTELEEKRRLEEEERQRLEQLMLAKMAAEERERYLRTKREEEEKLRKLAEDEKRRRLEEQQRAAEEAMRLAQEMARKQIELQRRLEFNRSLHSEASNLSQSQAVTRAFVFSYLELLKWLSLDHPSDNAQAKYADLQKSQ